MFFDILKKKINVVYIRTARNRLIGVRKRSKVLMKWTEAPLR